MRKVLRKVKSQWAVLGIMGATVIALGAVDVPQASADEIEGATTSESVLGSELGTVSEVLRASENAVQTNSQESEDSTNLVTQVEVTEFVEPQPTNEVSEEADYATIVSTIDVAYPAVISRATDAINSAPWGIQGYQTIGSSAYYVGRTVDVIKEQVTDYGVTWALVSMNGEELGWIAKDALTAQTYAAIVSETAVEYPATISRATDAINSSPWGIRGYQTIASSADYAGRAVEVTKEATTDYGVTWALVSVDGKEFGWIAKAALTTQTYAAIVSEAAVEYPAVISRTTDAINTAPWGTKGYQTISTSAAYAGQTVEVTQEQTTDYGVTWAKISLNGEVLGWVAKEALTVQTYAQITKETAVAYSATINRDSDAINTAPWGTKGYQTLATSAAYVDQAVEVTKEQETDYGVTWAQISLNGNVLGWIAKDALKVQTFAQITEETTVDYSATISRATDAINTAPWGTKGYQTLASSADYIDQTVEVTKEQVTDYGVTWAQISLNGEVLGWIAKEALTVQTYAKIVKETAVDYQATISRGTDAINTAPWGTKGYKTISSSADYVGQSVEVTKEQVTDYGVTWAQISLNGEVLGWIAKDAITAVETTTGTVNVKENMVAYQTVTEEDNTIPTGESQVAQAGADGYDTVTYDVTYVNGVETNRVEVSRTTIAPVNEITIKGTQPINDVTKPVIDAASVKVSSNTATLGESVLISVAVSDDTEVSSVYASLKTSFRQPNGAATFETVELHKNNTTGLFEGVLNITDSTALGPWQIAAIGATDTSGNAVTLFSTNVYDYWGPSLLLVPHANLSYANIMVTAEFADNTEPVIGAVKVFSDTVSSGESVTVSAEISDDRGIPYSSQVASIKWSGVEAVYFSPLTNSYESVSLYQNNMTGLFEGTLDITDASEVGTWILYRIGAFDTSGNWSILYNSNAVDYHHSPSTDLSSADFTVVDDIIVKDETVPSLSYTYSRETKGSEPVVIAVTATDEHSGVYSITLPDGTVVNAETAEFTVNQNGTYAVEAKDNAGNVYSTYIYVDMIEAEVIDDGEDSEAQEDVTKPTIYYYMDRSELSVDPLTVYIETEDLESGIESIILPDGTVVNAVSASFTAAVNGNYVVKAVDNNGNIQEVTVAVTLIGEKEVVEAPIDFADPNLFYTLSEEGMTTGPITVTLTAKDPEGNGSLASGIKSITLPDGTVIAGDTAQFEVSENGRYAVLVEDNAGHVKVENVDIFGIIEEEEEPEYVDTDIPDAQLILSTSAPTTGPINVTVVATDNVGVASITLPDGTVVNGSVANFTVDKNDFYIVKITDTAGNISYRTVNITNIQAPAVDTEFPVLSYEFSSNELGAKSLDVTVRATDNTEVAYLIAADGSTIIEGDEYTFTVTKNAIYTIQAVDSSGNVESINIDVHILASKPVEPTEDKTAPIILFYPSRTYSAAETFAIKAMVVEDGGIASFILPNGERSYSSTVDYIVYENGTYTFKATDGSGNETIASYEVTLVDGFIDKVGPEITYTVSNPNPTQEQSITVYVSIPDADFDHAVGPDGTIITNKDFSFVVTQNGFSDIAVYDKCGNVSRLTIPTFNIDKYAPNVGAREESRTADSVTYRLIANDDVDLVLVTRPDGTTENMSSNIDADFMEMMTFTKNGTYTFTAVDYFGKVATTTFVIDSLPE